MGELICLFIMHIVKKQNMKENRNWSIEEDQALRHLKEERGVKGWTQIAQILQRQFEIKGKSAKRCRERYCNYVSSSVKRDEWTVEEEIILFRLHNEKGNKWVEIGQQLERPDNAIKNHYHSKLRKALRKVNKIIYEHLRSEFKPIKNSILPKMIQTAEEYYQQADKDQLTPAKNCYLMKNRILDFLNVDESTLNERDIAELREFVREVNYFNKTYKKRKNKKDYPQRARSNLYKGKQIINLIQQNQKVNKIIEEVSSISMEGEEEDSKLSIAGQQQQNKQNNSNESQSNMKEGIVPPMMVNISHQFTLPFLINCYPYHFYLHPAMSYNYSV